MAPPALMLIIVGLIVPPTPKNVISTFFNLLSLGNGS